MFQGSKAQFRVVTASSGDFLLLLPPSLRCCCSCCRDARRLGGRLLISSCHRQCRRIVTAGPSETPPAHMGLLIGSCDRHCGRIMTAGPSETPPAHMGFLIGSCDRHCGRIMTAGPGDSSLAPLTHRRICCPHRWRGGWSFRDYLRGRGIKRCGLGALIFADERLSQEDDITGLVDLILKGKRDGT